jgi:GNAT superfamily N-acetyltransferase
MTDVEVRIIRDDELAALLDLYTHLHPSDAPLPEADGLKLVWEEIVHDPKIQCLVVERDDKLVASCTLVRVPNLTRGARPYGLIENVVTRAGYRKQGVGTELLRQALAIAWRENCYKVMLLTGSKREETHRFYEQAGFTKGIKTGFIAMPPVG